MKPQASSQLADELILFLRCPSCQGTVEEMEPGGFRCPNCGREFPERLGVVRCVPPQNYADSFGFQWHKYDRTQLDEGDVRSSERNFQRRTGFTPEELCGKLVLDVGCGMGRFAEVATRYGARVVGIDLSAAAEVAVRNLAERDFIAFQADVFELPFAPATFDYIYSLGVLHHTPNCEKAFRALPKYLKPGGEIAIWVYSGYNKWYRFSDIYRHFTSRMSARRLHSVLRVLVPFFYGLGRLLRKVPLVGKPLAGSLQYVFPVNQNPNPEIRILDTFDWYSPKYQSKHTYEEVFRWFESEGLSNMRVLEQSVSLRGQKPETHAEADCANDAEHLGSTAHAR
jgi:2-polyprenyl-3-methyl-5-hydroxy-6-metoxy-1,4-benzoquinol methylase